MPEEQRVRAAPHRTETEASWLQRASQPRETMSRWSVADVSAFFESKDAVGLATTFTANAVQGEDLLRFTGDDLVADLRMTRFGARKALALRDAFLRGLCAPCVPSWSSTHSLPKALGTTIKQHVCDISRMPWKQRPSPCPSPVKALSKPPSLLSKPLSMQSVTLRKPTRLHHSCSEASDQATFL